MGSRYVLDAGAFYAGIPFLSSDGRYCTTELVFNEIRHIKSSQGAIEVLLNSGNLTIENPDRLHVKRVAAAARKTGDYPRLSQADISVLALAMQLKTVLVSGDYAVANVASTLKIPVKAAGGSKGIKETRKWVSYCSACGKAFAPDAKECPLCGNSLKRKYKVT